MPLLEVRGLRSGYGKIEVISGIDLTVDLGDYVAVVGANGAGKTTLLRSVSGTADVLDGHLAFEGTDLRAVRSYQVPGLGIAHVPEGRQIFPRLSVWDNLMAGAWLRRKTAERQESLDLVFGLFPRLRERRSQLGGTLSGGEQQMLAIARALMLRPRLLMLDEPSQGLAPKVVGDLYERLATVHESGTTILLVEQNTAAALTFSRRAYVMEHGRIVLEGSVDELRGSDEIRRAYLGV